MSAGSCYPMARPPFSCLKVVHSCLHLLACSKNKLFLVLHVEHDFLEDVNMYSLMQVHILELKF